MLLVGAFAGALGYYGGCKTNIRVGPIRVGVGIEGISNARV